MNPNPYAKQQKEYLKTQVQTASKEQLVLMLMDGILRFSEQGRQAIHDKNIEKKQFALVRTQDIIIELVNGLDHEKGGDIATNLSRLYAYALKRLVEANLKNDTTGIDEVQNIFKSLREAWAIAMETVAKERAEGQPSALEQSAAAAPVMPSSQPDKAEIGRVQPAMAGSALNGTYGAGKKLNIPKLAPRPLGAGLGAAAATAGSALAGGMQSRLSLQG